MPSDPQGQMRTYALSIQFLIVHLVCAWTTVYAIVLQLSPLPPEHANRLPQYWFAADYG